MSRVNVVGVDPGPIPGIVALQFAECKLIHVDVIQCSHEISVVLFEQLLTTLGIGLIPTIVQVERFVVGRRSSRSSTAGAGASTRDLVGALEVVTGRAGAMFSLQNAGTVKPWATDERLEVAGLLEATKGMRHAKDAARHALYAAVREAAQPDPLSKEWRAVSFNE